MLKVVTEPNVISGALFAFVVPAGEIWSLRSVIANCARGAGGLPDRAYQLQITDGTNVVAAFGAADAGTEPGDCVVTWAGCPAGADASGAHGIVSAPMRADRCPTGYQIIGQITGSVVGDAWTDAAVWLDYVES